jgi:phycocyanobilin lyase subunit beta
MSEVQTLIEAVDRADSAEALLEAVENLAAVRTEDAIATLVTVLRYNNPGASVAAVDGLIAIGEPVVPYLLENLDEYNYGARAWATRVFAGIGDPLALDLLVKAAISDFSQSVRRSAAKGLGNILWSKLDPKVRSSAQQEVLKTLLLASGDGEWVVRYAAIVGLQFLAAALLKEETTRRVVSSRRVVCREVSELISEIKARYQEIMANDAEGVIRIRARYALQQL